MVMTRLIIMPLQPMLTTDLLLPVLEAVLTAGNTVGRLSWLPVSFLLHIKYTLLYRIVNTNNNNKNKNNVSCLVRPGFCPVPSVCKNAERISVKFVGDDHYHQQIK